MDQAGVAEATWQSLDALDTTVEMGLAASSILLTGGNTNMPNFRERFDSEIRPYVPDAFPVTVHTPAQPDTYAWRGASRFVKNTLKSGGMQELGEFTVSKAFYLENGHARSNQAFEDSW
jgi:actin-related protein